MTANNIANATTPGYSTELTQFSENSPQNINGLQFGTGSSISSVERLRDIYLDSQIRTELTQVGYNDTLNSSMQQLAAIFPDVASPGIPGSLTSLINNFYSAWSTLASNPTSNADKQAVITDALGLSAQLRQTMQGLAGLSSNLDSQVSASVGTANSLINQIAAYNAQIKLNPNASNTLQDSAGTGHGEPGQPDERPVRHRLGLGTVSVLFAKGTLVSGTVATDFTTVKGLPDPTLVKIGFPQSEGASAADVTDSITGGKLGALLQMRDTVVQNALYAVRAIGSGLIDNTNLIYHAASNSSGVHSNFFDGTSAGDISVDPTLATSTTGAALLSSFTASSTPGDLAASMAGAQNDFTATYIQSSKPIGAAISGTAPNFQPGDSFSWNRLFQPQEPSISTSRAASSSAVVNWNNGQSLTTIAANITQALAGIIAGTAVYDETTGKFSILFDQQVSMYDAAGDFSTAARLTSFLTSATTINTNLDATINPISSGVSLDQTTPIPNVLPNSLLSYFEQALPKGSYSVDGGTVIWNNNQSMSAITGLVAGATGGQISAKFNHAVRPSGW